MCILYEPLRKTILKIYLLRKNLIFVFHILKIVYPYFTAKNHNNINIIAPKYQYFLKRLLLQTNYFRTHSDIFKKDKKKNNKMLLVSVLQNIPDTEKYTVMYFFVKYDSTLHVFTFSFVFNSLAIWERTETLHRTAKIKRGPVKI